MPDNSHEKIAPASQKKLQELKKHGYSAKSYDFNNFVILFTSTICILIFFYNNQELYKIANYNFQLSRDVLFNNESLLQHLSISFVMIFKSILPYFTILIVASIIANLIPGGFNFSIELLNFKSDRINPIKGISRVFSMKNIFEIFILIFKIIFMITAIMIYIFMYKKYIADLSFNNIKASIIYAIYYILTTAFFLVSLILVISIIDIPYRKYRFNKDAEMTHEELKDEQKNNEGSSEVKSARKLLFRKILNKNKK